MEDVKREVRDFWNANPCGVKFTTEETGTRHFFSTIDQYRYTHEWHIPGTVGFDRFGGKKVLEIGCGVGSDGAQFVKNGALYVGTDLAFMPVYLSSRRFTLFGLVGSFLESDAENLPFKSNHFDLVFAHGVLHHTPNMDKAISEIYRVLKEGGEAIIMLYHRNSWNYYGNIMFLRRLGVFFLKFDLGVQLVHKLTGETLAMLKKHQERLRRNGISYLSRDIFLSKNTDGPENPLSRIFSAREAKQIFCVFSQVHTRVRFLHKRWIPIIGKFIPMSIERLLSRLIGWHLYIFATK